MRYKRNLYRKSETIADETYLYIFLAAKFRNFVVNCICATKGETQFNRVAKAASFWTRKEIVFYYFLRNPGYFDFIEKVE